MLSVLAALGAPAAGPVYETVVGDVDTRVFVPEGPGPLRGVIVHAANYKLSADDRWAELCRELRFAHAALNIPNVQKATNRGPRLHKALHEGLKEFAAASGHPELPDLPMAGVGHSAGVPAAPRDMRALAQGDAVRVTWADAAADEVGFRVERSPDGRKAWAVIAYRPPHARVEDAEALAWVDVTAPPGRPLRYRVRALNLAEDERGVSVPTGPVTLPAPAK